MKKKLYEKPSSKVIELKHRQQLLVGRSAPGGPALPSDAPPDYSGG
jgi:hypothetical protein